MAKASAMAAAKAVVAQINKDSDEDGLVVFGSDIVRREIPRVSSGSLALDDALGGGWAANQWNELVGESSHGKTGLVLKTIAHNQAVDPDWIVGWVAAEHFSVPYASLMGCDIDRIAVVDTTSMEAAFNAVVKMCTSRAFDCVVIDSLPALVPTAEYEEEIEEFQVGLAARLTNKFTRKARAGTRRSLVEEERPVIGFMINQYREKIGVRYGDPRTTPGGKGKDFFYYQRVEVRRDDFIKDGKRIVGQTIVARVLKNKTAPGGRTAELDLYLEDYGDHRAGEFDLAKEVTAVAVQREVVHKQGAYYWFGTTKLEGYTPDPETGELKARKGAPGLQAYLDEHPELIGEIRDHVMAGTIPPREDPEPPKAVVKKKVATDA